MKSHYASIWWRKIETQPSLLKHLTLLGLGHNRFGSGNGSGLQGDSTSSADNRFRFPSSSSLSEKRIWLVEPYPLPTSPSDGILTMTRNRASMGNSFGQASKAHGLRLIICWVSFGCRVIRREKDGGDTSNHLRDHQERSLPHRQFLQRVQIAPIGSKQKPWDEETRSETRVSFQKQDPAKAGVRHGESPSHHSAPAQSASH